MNKCYNKLLQKQSELSAEGWCIEQHPVEAFWFIAYKFRPNKEALKRLYYIDENKKISYDKEILDKW